LESALYKKIFLSLITAGLLSTPVLAVTMKVEAMSSFSTENPTNTITVKVLKDCKLSESLVISEGDVVYANVTDVVSPKRLKRNATFSVVPQTYTDKSGVTHTFDKNFTGKYTGEIDKKELAKSATLTVGNYFVKGLSLGVNAVEGAVKNEEGNRLKSSAKNVYENTPFSYIEEGQELEIQTGDVFGLKFKSMDDEEDNAPNYNYTMPEDIQ